MSYQNPKRPVHIDSYENNGNLRDKEFPKLEQIAIGDCFQCGNQKIKVVGFKGRTTVLVSIHPIPMASRPLPARGIRIKTLLRDWAFVPPK